MDYDALLKKHGLKYEDLNAAERETYTSMVASLQQNVLTVEAIRAYIDNMIHSVEDELSRFDLGSKQDIFLKARLRNYMLLRAVLQSPEKAKKQLELALKGMG